MISGIPGHERPAVLRLFLYCLLCGSSYTLARTAGDSLFLSRAGNADLPSVFVASGIVTALLASVWFVLVKRLSLRLSLRVTGIALGVLSLTAWALLPALHHSYYLLALVYLLAEIKGCINAINVASSLNIVLGGHSSRTAWATVLLGLPIASILIGGLISIEASFVGVGTFLLLAAILDFSSLLPTLHLQRVVVQPPPQGKVEGSFAHGLEQVKVATKRYVCSDRFGIWVGVLIGAKVVVLTLIAFEWKTAVNNYFVSDEEALARYFGIFYAFTGFATFLIQFFFTGRMLYHRNVVLPILVMPLAFLFLNLFVILGTGVLLLFVITTVAKGMDAWRRSAHDTALHFLHTKIERKRRRDVIGVNSALVKPAAEVAASLALMLGARWVHQSLLVAGTIVWLLAVASLLALLNAERREEASRQQKETDDSQPASGFEKLISGLPNDG